MLLGNAIRVAPHTRLSNGVNLSVRTRCGGGGHITTFLRCRRSVFIRKIVETILKIGDIVVNLLHIMVTVFAEIENGRRRRRRADRTTDRARQRRCSRRRRSYIGRKRCLIVSRVAVVFRRQQSFETFLGCGEAVYDLLPMQGKVSQHLSNLVETLHFIRKYRVTYFENIGSGSNKMVGRSFVSEKLLLISGDICKNYYPVGDNIWLLCGTNADCGASTEMGVVEPNSALRKAAISKSDTD
uniref:Uncharacterized protein n=1 Tax=Romanomermis culicivorax TaxID=13658 RepID=A0A915LAS8_ROMCU